MIATCSFLIGLLLAIQQGDWFPWANLVGLGLMGLSAALLERRL